MSRRTFLSATLLLVACSGDPASPDDPSLRDAPASAAAASAWIAQAAYPNPVWEATSVAVTDPGTGRANLYVIGGQRKEFAGPANITDAVKAYDVKTNRWRSRAPYPVRIVRSNAAVEVGGKIYVSGGSSRVWDEQRGVYRADPLLLHHVYDPGANKWTRKRDLPYSMISGVGAAYQGQIYIVARCADLALCADERLDAIWRYDPSNDTWTLLSSAPGDYEVGGFIGGKLHLVTRLGQMDIYDVASNTWSTGPQRPRRLCGQTSTTLQARLYLVGFCEEGGTSTYPTLVFDPKAGTWSEGPAAPAKTREYHTVARVSVNGVLGLHLIGGPESANHWRLVP